MTPLLMADTSAHPTCPHCKYDLRAHLNSVGARCPECGAFTHYREFFPRRSARQIHGSWYLYSLLQIPVAFTIAVVFLGTMPFLAALAIVLAFMILCNLFVARQGLGPTGRHFNRRTTVRVTTGLLLFNAIMTGALIALAILIAVVTSDDTR